MVPAHRTAQLRASAKFPPAPKGRSSGGRRIAVFAIYAMGGYHPLVPFSTRRGVQVQFAGHRPALQHGVASAKPLAVSRTQRAGRGRGKKQFQIPRHGKAEPFRTAGGRAANSVLPKREPTTWAVSAAQGIPQGLKARRWSLLTPARIPGSKRGLFTPEPRARCSFSPREGRAALPWTINGLPSLSVGFGLTRPAIPSRVP